MVIVNFLYEIYVGFYMNVCFVACFIGLFFSHMAQGMNMIGGEKALAKHKNEADALPFSTTGRSFSDPDNASLYFPSAAQEILCTALLLAGCSPVVHHYAEENRSLKQSIGWGCTAIDEVVKGEKTDPAVFHEHIHECLKAPTTKKELQKIAQELLQDRLVIRKEEMPSIIEEIVKKFMVQKRTELSAEIESLQSAIGKAHSRRIYTKMCMKRMQPAKKHTTT